MNQMANSDFKAKRVTRSYTQTINAAPSEVFPLLCPVREAEWLDGWDHSLVYSETGFAEEGCVFISRQEDEKDTIWVITKRDEETKEIEFVRTTPDSRVAKLNISVEDAGNSTSDVLIIYTFTALCEEGNRLIDNLTEERFSESMAFWQKSMNHFLETGKKLKAPSNT